MGLASPTAAVHTRHPPKVASTLHPESSPPTSPTRTRDRPACSHEWAGRSFAFLAAHQHRGKSMPIHRISHHIMRIALNVNHLKRHTPRHLNRRLNQRNLPTLPHTPTISQHPRRNTQHKRPQRQHNRRLPRPPRQHQQREHKPQRTQKRGSHRRQHIPRTLNEIIRLHPHNTLHTYPFQLKPH